MSVFSYHGRKKLSRDGQIARYKVVQYPDTEGAKPGYSARPGAKVDPYPQKLLPCNRLQIHHHPTAPEGLVVDVNAFSVDFFLAIVFAEVFALFFVKSLQKRAVKDAISYEGEKKKEEPQKIHRTALFHLLDGLGSFFLEAPLPAFMKEIIFHLLAQLLRASSMPDSNKQPAEQSSSSSSNPFVFGLIINRLSPLRIELHKLLEKELSVTNSAALDFILNCNFENSKLSSYLQALLELVLATNEIAQPPLAQDGEGIDAIGEKVSRRSSFSDVQEQVNMISNR